MLRRLGSFEERKISRRLRLEVGQSETAFSFGAAGAGIAIVDPISAYNNPYAHITARPFEPAVEFDIWLIRPKAARSFNLIERFVEHALTQLQDFSDELGRKN